MTNTKWLERHPTEILIDQARELLKPSPVRLHHIPDWFRLRLLKVYGCSFGYTDGWSVLERARLQNGWHWVDHHGSTKLPDGRIAFVSEPYGLSLAKMQQIHALAEAIDCETWVSPNSWWYPGATVRVVFAEKKV